MPKKTDIVLSDAFRNIVLYGVANVKRIVIPDSVDVIGKEAVCLDDGAYVTCSVGSKAYSYCKQNNIKNTVDITIWKQYGKCQHCGGDLSFLFRRCKNCGRVKNY